jgi:hypothetical protein
MGSLLGRRASAGDAIGGGGAPDLQEIGDGRRRVEAMQLDSVGWGQEDGEAELPGWSGKQGRRGTATKSGSLGGHARARVQKRRRGCV